MVTIDEIDKNLSKTQIKVNLNNSLISIDDSNLIVNVWVNRNMILNLKFRFLFFKINFLLYNHLLINLNVF